MGKVRLSKNQLRRQKEKQRKLEHGKSEQSGNEENKLPSSGNQQRPLLQNDLVFKERIIDPENSLYKQYESILNKFDQKEVPKKVSPLKENHEIIKPETVLSDEYESESDTTETKLSKRQLRLQNKVSMAKLKLFAKDPKIVEAHDVDAPDPYMLISIKQNLNIVPVLSHWSAKRDYLSGQRGLDRPPFQLPLYILETGIQDMRNSADDQTLKQLQRERVQPKLGKLDIDYQKLYNAFYHNQTRPRLFPFGDVYYEGRDTVEESETKLVDVQPGKLSQELLKALGLPENGKTPPPWISTMTQLGKPPAYRNLLIPGIDIAYANVGYVDGEEELVLDKLNDTWGHIEDDDESEDGDYDEDDNRKEETELADPDIVPYENTSEAERSETDNIVSDPVNKLPKLPKQLYKILNDVEVGNNKQYDLNSNQETRDIDQEQLEPKQKNKLKEDVKKFKF